MKKLLVLAAACLLMVSILAGCTGTIVVVGDCTCPTAGNPQPSEPKPTVNLGEGAVKTGLYVYTKVSDSTSATADSDGAVKFDILVVAVTVDDEGVIHSAYIDSLPATVSIGSNGIITSDLSAEILTKNEMGADYGMVAWGGAIAEWDAQVAALCSYAVGKTVEELKNGAIDESGKAPAGSDLASSATIYLGDYVNAIEAAAANATHLGASAGDKLTVVTLNTLESSVSATADKDGTVQFDVNIAAVTSKDGIITSCIIDAVQAKISFNTSGVITTDLSKPILTKNEMGADYGMVAWGGAIAEWNEQAASFASYVTGKTAAEVAGIAVNESSQPAGGTDLAASVTIKIGDFQALIAKAFGK